MTQSNYVTSAVGASSSGPRPVLTSTVATLNVKPRQPSIDDRRSPEGSMDFSRSLSADKLLQLSGIL